VTKIIKVPHREQKELSWELSWRKNFKLHSDENNGGGHYKAIHDWFVIQSGPNSTQFATKADEVTTIRRFLNRPSLQWHHQWLFLVNRNMRITRSESVAGCVQDYGRALISWRSVPWKGQVQLLQEVDQGQLKVTQAKILIASLAKALSTKVHARPSPFLFDRLRNHWRSALDKPITLGPNHESHPFIGKCPLTCYSRTPRHEAEWRRPQFCCNQCSNRRSVQ